MAETKDYTVTEKAGPMVAGRRVAGSWSEAGKFIPDTGQILKLTDAEADYELGQETIVPAKGTKPEPKALKAPDA